MANNKSDYLENAIADHVLGGNALTQPANYIALSTTTINEDGTGLLEPTGGYARQAVTFGAASGGQKANSGDVLFGPASGSWGTITDFAIYDAASNGNQLYQGPLQSGVPVADGETARFSTGALTVTET
ncbi:unnamed protein product [marine sediment metagenome]|uniref:Uncharacterized protein n=1 Tax=marine sediment metagenome TaxID=412755 RepID=X0WP96_9ZZZZ